MHTPQFLSEIQDFQQLPERLVIEDKYQNDQEYLKNHFQSQKEDIKQILEHFLRFTRNLSTEHFVEYEKVSSFLKSLNTAFSSLDESQKDKKENITQEIVKYHQQVQDILHFEEKPEFKNFQNIISQMKDFRQKLNLAIPLFESHEWEEVLEVLKIVDDIEKKLTDMIKYNGYRKKEYTDTVHSFHQEIRKALKNTPWDSPEKQKILSKWIPFFR